MSGNTTGVWETLENWSSTAFLVAGVLSVIAAVVYAVNAFTGATLGGGLTGPPRLASILLAYVGFFGLYPRLADETRRLARVGLVLLVAPVVGNFLLLFVYAPVANPSPSLVGALTGLIVAFWALMGVGGALLGVASIRTPGLSRGVGAGLLGWFLLGLVLAGAGLVYGGDSPAWVSFVMTGIAGASLVVVGYSLRTYSAGRDRTTPTDTTG